MAEVVFTNRPTQSAFRGNTMTQLTTTAIPNSPSAPWRRLMKALNPFMKGLLRSPFHGLVSHRYLLLNFTGRRSGSIYTTPVQYVQYGHTLTIITSEGYSWWKNLVGGAAVQVHLRGRDYVGQAKTSSVPLVVDAVLRAMYPGMDETTRQQFVPGKVAVTIVLE
jgi:deazaflavin-dependent oxidoreductase (nitroreductase family)